MTHQFHLDSPDYKAGTRIDKGRINAPPLQLVVRKYVRISHYGISVDLPYVYECEVLNPEGWSLSSNASLSGTCQQIA